MKHCDKCNIDVRGTLERCPLCQHTLTGEATPAEFPVVVSIYEKYEWIFKLAILVTSALTVISIAVNMMLPQSGKWSLFVLFGTICAWISASIFIKKQHVLPQNIVTQAVIISILCVIWDMFTHWHGWSIDYVVPIIFSSAMTALFVLSKVIKLNMPDYIFSIVICIFFGLIPLILCLVGVTRLIIPSAICIALSVLFLITLILYNGHELLTTLSKKFHI